MQHKHTLLDQLAAAGLVSARQQEDGTITVSITAGYSDPRNLKGPERPAFGVVQELVMRAVRDYPDDRVPLRHVHETVIDQLPIPDKRDTRAQRTDRAVEKLVMRKHLGYAENHVWLPRSAQRAAHSA